ncbi:MAG: glycosyltransferase family 2 protein [Patescibacteria group bacterium]
MLNTFAISSKNFAAALKNYLMKNFNSGISIWNQRFKLKQTKLKLKQLADAVGHISDSSLAQYAQMFAIALEFKPDLIVEFGRGTGNSTAVFTEAANQLEDCSVISICNSNDWQNQTSSRIAKIVPKDWFDKLDAQISDILDIKFRDLISKASPREKEKKKILFLWDAHGWDVAEYVLSEVLPSLKSKEHLVMVHDISHYMPEVNGAYGSSGLWKGYPGDDVKNPTYLILGEMASPFDELVPIYDFMSRNQLPIYSVSEQINEFFKNNPDKENSLKQMLGPNIFNSSSSFHHFTLNSTPKSKKLFFPQSIKKDGLESLPPISFEKDKEVKYSAFQEDMPLVSVVTPSFNSGKFIEECIQSVLNQDYPYVEHIIQDGGSKDNTLKILKKYSTPKYKDRVKWVSSPDKGQSDGLDKAIKLSTGDVILVLNADDVLLPYACSWGVFNLKLNPNVAVVYGDEYIIDETGKIIHEFTGPRYDYEKLLCVEIVPAAQTAFIRRSYFEQVGLGTDSSLETCPDYEMWVRIGARFPMKYSPGFVCKYRWHTGSEGQQPSMILKMVEAKKQVMDRVFNDKKTPKRIKKLRKRAYAGVEIWGAINNMQLRGPVPITAKLVISSFLNYPPNIAKYRKLIPRGILSFSNLILNTYAKKFFK